MADPTSYEAVVEHLTYAAELEKTLYTYKNLHNRIQSKIDSLGHYKTVPEYTVRTDILFICVIVLILGAFFWLIRLFRYGTVGIVIAALIGIILLPSSIKVIKMFIIRTKSKGKIKKIKADDEVRVANERLAITKLKQQQNEIRANYNATSNLLKKLYNMDIIYPTYRHMAAVTTILEYFNSGRCYQLQGHDGAYNLFSFEEKQNIIISKMDRIIDQLEQIRSTQYMLYDAINSVKVTLNRVIEQNEEIIRTNNQIAQNTELIAYNTSVIRRNAEISAYLDMKNSPRYW